MTAAPAGERYGEVPGYYFERRRATFPGTHRHPHTSRPVTSSTSSSRPAASSGTSATASPRRQAGRDQEARARRRRRGLHRRLAERDPPATPPRRATWPYKSSPSRPPATRSTPTTSTPAGQRRPDANGTVFPAIKYPTFLGVLSHFDAVVYYTGDDFVPQDSTNTNPRRMTQRTAQTGSHEIARGRIDAMLELRDYANEGGKLVVDGRNVHQTFTGTAPACRLPARTRGRRTSSSASTTRTTTPATTTCAGTAFQRSRTTSNDTWQYYLGVIGRQSGAASPRAPRPTTPTGDRRSSPVAAVGRRPVRRHGARSPINESSTGDPNQAADGIAAAAATSRGAPAQLGRAATSRCARRRSRPTTPPRSPTRTTGGAIISTRDAVTFGFGLEQVDRRRRATSSLKRAWATCCRPRRTPRRRRSSASSTRRAPPRPRPTRSSPRSPPTTSAATWRRSTSTPTARSSARPRSSRSSSATRRRPRRSVRRSRCTAEAIDKAGNKSTPDPHVRVVAADGAATVAGPGRPADASPARRPSARR